MFPATDARQRLVAFLVKPQMRFETFATARLSLLVYPRAAPFRPEIVDPLPSEPVGRLRQTFLEVERVGFCAG